MKVVLLAQIKNQVFLLPDLKKISNAYGIKFIRVNKLEELDNILEKVLLQTEPVICEVICPEDQEIIPTVSSIKKKMALWFLNHWKICIHFG